ncbi:valine--tRNA ligase [Clostridium sp. 'deep sea']|uniref:valine--tRNA ligase n=1 Tax=Clostridium sp. 'deep sea' TaxID=2779445 RepID=UPI001896742B|nr:valine--tRNA ligase [Clostridium sp. 'deep sea']QOR36384.1 valine--tRNA ligase [Clostridium sp. 'deep sea']
MSQQIPKNYNHTDTEKKWYKLWEEKGYFKPVKRDPSKGKFSIMMPPPNVTGQLHIGHALDMTLQDILVRYKRQQGYEACWIPGTDHAGIATQRKVRDALRKEGIDMQDLGREKFIERVWQWKDKYGSTITNQLRALGSSCDWDRESFTMDERCSKAVKEAFVSLYEKGLIYKGSYIINWCPECGTTLSDIEVEHHESAGKLYHVAYPLAEGEGEIIIATTRPETILGDVAVAVHPDDERYKHLVGKHCILPIANRKIPIVADYYVEKEFGSGAVKITPAHDPNDFAIGQRHNLPEINIMNEDATINENGAPYTGMSRYDCRKALIRDLEGIGLLRNIEDHQHNVGHCTRCETTVEPLIKNQWFVKMKPLAERAIEAARKKDVKFVPDRFEKIYLQWLEKIRDWCISRQLWWGHQIPAWYCTCGEIIVSKETPSTCPKCGGKNLIQDEDVLDTWFSSALWPFSTQGWPDLKPEQLDFYPTSTLVTGYDIIFFWVVRMITMGLECTDQVPFDTVLLHGLVRDSQGRKMSKSLGNGVDPLEAIADFGADVLRFTLVTGNTPGNDMRFHMERLESNRNFTNKMWNAARFVQLNLAEFKWSDINLTENLSLADKWILSRFSTLITEINRVVNRYEFGEAARMLYDFLWSEYCDWYIEMAKPRLYSDNEADKLTTRSVLITVLSGTLQLLHPFMPFITEELWQSLPHKGESIVITALPEANYYNEDTEKVMAVLMDAVRSIRNIRQESDVKPSQRIKAIIMADNIETQQMFIKNEIYLKTLAGLGELEVKLLQKDQAPTEEALTAIVSGATIYLPLAGLIDLAKETERLQKELKRLQGEVKRANGKINNEKFVSKAPAHIVDAERQKLEDYKAQLQAVKDRIASLAKLK